MESFRAGEDSIIASVRIQLAMRLVHFTLSALVLTCTAWAQQPRTTPVPRSYIGFDANNYPGDALLPTLRKQFSFTGYWLTNPPGTNSNSWIGKREILAKNGFGFLVAANGRLDKEILRAQKSGKSPASLAKTDAATAVAAATREGFPAGTIIFLDQEEGGRLLDEQASYLLAWTEAVAATGYHPGVYASGKPVPDGKGPNGKPVTITTIQDIRQHVTAQHLHPIAFWVIQDACPPAPGCVVDSAHTPAPDQSLTLDATAWQFAQSPREKSITLACGATYNRDGNCYAPGIAHMQLDLSSSTSPDPSHGR
jgi:hypothetical protein